MIYQLVRDLRARMNAPVLRCKEALENCGGDIHKAIDMLRMQGMETNDNLANRGSNEGVVASYIDTSSNLGVLCEVNCETDFAARTEEFKSVAKNIAIQIAACNPRWISREKVPKEMVKKRNKIIDVQIRHSPCESAKIKDASELDRSLGELCLLEQRFVKEPNITVGQYVNRKSREFGEKVAVRRFVRFQLGEDV